MKISKKAFSIALNSQDLNKNSNLYKRLYKMVLEEKLKPEHFFFPNPESKNFVCKRGFITVMKEKLISSFSYTMQKEGHAELLKFFRKLSNYSETLEYIICDPDTEQDSLLFKMAVQEALRTQVTERSLRYAIKYYRKFQNDKNSDIPQHMLENFIQHNGMLEEALINNITANNLSSKEIFELEFLAFKHQIFRNGIPQKDYDYFARSAAELDMQDKALEAFDPKSNFHLPEASIRACCALLNTTKVLNPATITKIQDWMESAAKSGPLLGLFTIHWLSVLKGRYPELINSIALLLSENTVDINYALCSFLLKYYPEYLVRKKDQRSFEGFQSIYPLFNNPISFEDIQSFAQLYNETDNKKALIQFLKNNDLYEIVIAEQKNRF